MLETHPSAWANIWQTVERERRLRLAPPPKLTVSQWADTRRQLSREASAEPGQWSTSRAPYQRGILDAINEPGIETVVVMAASQVGKTEILLNILGYFMDQDPSPILLVQPTIDEAEQFSKTRIAPMLRDTPVLRDKVRNPTSRESGNTLRIKEFPGGHLTIVGANSASGLAAKPIRVVLGDEVDRWPASAGTEGDPMALAEARAATWWNRKYVWVSSPTLKGGRIETAFLEGDQRELYMPCLSCGHMQIIKFSNFTSETGADGNHIPETVRVACVSCGTLHAEHEKHKMLARGEWRAAAPTYKCASFKIPGLVSPWRTWAEVQEKYNASKGDTERRQAFINTVLGEPYEDRYGGLDPKDLESRVGRGYPAPPAEVPNGVALLLMGGDVQDTRIELTVWGLGEGMQRWRIAHIIIPGDPGNAETWERVEQVRTRQWVHESGQVSRIYATAIDSGAHTDAVYAYCRPRHGQRCFAVKGSSTPGAPIAPQYASTKNRAKVPLYIVGTEAGKDNWYSALRMGMPGPNYVNFDMGTDQTYLDQLTAEHLKREQVNGRWTRRYVLPRGKRAEALDCAVYALAAFHITGYRRERLAALAAQLAIPTDAPPPPPPPPEPLVPAAPNMGVALALQRAAARLRGGFRR